jgi:hypothetical protein
MPLPVADIFELADTPLAASLPLMMPLRFVSSPRRYYFARPRRLAGQSASAFDYADYGITTRHYIAFPAFVVAR